MSKKISLQTKVDEDLSIKFVKCAKKRGHIKWLAVEKAMKMYIEESENDQQEGMK